METFVHDLNGVLLALLLVAVLALLCKSADVLVTQAVTLSEGWGMPKVLMGATIVSMGTTMPEAVISVLAALRDSPELALGNAVGSIICDTGLILGLAALIAPLPLDRTIVNRQGWIQIACGVLLVLACIPYSHMGSTFTSGSHLPRAIGFVFLLLLVLYLWLSVHWAKAGAPAASAAGEAGATSSSTTLAALAKLIAAIALVVGSSWLLIPAVKEVAGRLGVPDSVIAATLVALGTSLPELVTAVTAARKGHGELAIGNVIGADILNVLFVAGAAAAVTTGGLAVPALFFKLLFPAMLVILIVFRVGILLSGKHLSRVFGAILLLTYIAVTVYSFIMGTTG